MPAAHLAECPWQSLAEYGLPNVDWCEERLCALVNEPANAWSNLAFLVVALVVYAWNRRAPPGSPALRAFAPAVAAVGVCSFVYHASNVLLTQLLDFLGMYLFTVLLLALNLTRLGWLSPRRTIAATVLGSLALTAFTAAIVGTGAPIQAIVGALVVAVLATEALARRRTAERASLTAFAAGVALLGAAGVCSALDVTRAWCDPTDHVLQGHALWHVLSAGSLLAGFVHFRAFDRALTP